MTQELWETILSRAGAVLNFGIEKKEQVRNSKMAKLIAATPYLAGCNKAFQTSFSHLIIYLMSLDESAKDIYFHNEEDDSNIYSRLFPISSFSGGNKNIIQCSIDLIALCMLCNYKKNVEEDMAIGKYNPINECVWDYDSLYRKLSDNINNLIDSTISDIYTIEDSMRGFWGE